MELFWLGLAFSLFIALFNGIGIFTTLGYWIPALLEEFQGSYAQTQLLVGCFQSGWFCGGFFATPIIRRHGYRAAYSASGGLFVGVLFAVSFASQLWMVYLLFFAGMGAQAAFSTAACLMPQHMPMSANIRYGALAMTGSGCGTVAVSFVSSVLQRSIGWRMGFRVLALGFGVLYGLGSFLVVEPQPGDAASASGGRYSWLLRNSRCRITLAAWALAGAKDMPYAVLGTHAQVNGLSMQNIAAVYSAWGICVIFGRLCMVTASHWINPVYLWVAGLAGSASSIMVLAIGTSFWPLALGNSMLGLSIAPVNGLMVPLWQYFAGKERLPEALTLTNAGQALIALSAPSVAGWLADRTGSFTWGLLLGCIVVFGGVILMLPVIVEELRRDELGSSPTTAPAPKNKLYSAEAAAVLEAAISAVEAERAADPKTERVGECGPPSGNAESRPRQAEVEKLRSIAEQTCFPFQCIASAGKK